MGAVFISFAMHDGPQGETCVPVQSAAAFPTVQWDRNFSPKANDSGWYMAPFSLFLSEDMYLISFVYTVHCNQLPNAVNHMEYLLFPPKFMSSF